MVVPRLAVERKCLVFHFLVRIRILSAVPDKGDPNQYGSTDLDPKHWRNENLSILCRCIPELDSLYNKQTIGPAGRLHWYRGVTVLLPSLVIGK